MKVPQKKVSSKKELNIINKKKGHNYTIETKYDKDGKIFQCLKLSNEFMRRQL